MAGGAGRHASWKAKHLVAALFALSAFQLVCAEYTWNGSDWVWNDKVGLSSVCLSVCLSATFHT